MITIYGTIDNTGAFKRTGNSLHGAKCSATRRGLTVVATQSALGYNIDIVARKVGAKWGRDGTL